MSSSRDRKVVEIVLSLVDRKISEALGSLDDLISEISAGEDYDFSSRVRYATARLEEARTVLNKRVLNDVL